MRSLTPVERLKSALSIDSVRQQFENALSDSAPLFIASLIDVYGSEKALQSSDPATIIREALKAATLKLPINRALGFAYIVPYKGQATMQIGYKGFIQLAQRTGQYKFINAGKVFEGELEHANKLTGEIFLSGTAINTIVAGYFAYIETVNGFRKAEYWTTEEVTAHAKRYSPAFATAAAPWQKEFDKMAIKTVLKSLLSTYGYLSIEMVGAMNHDSSPQGEVENNANTGEPIDVSPENPAPQEVAQEGPGF